jgi:hypothetical protein
MVLNEKPSNLKFRIHSAFPISVAEEVDIALNYIPEDTIFKNNAHKYSSCDIGQINIYGESIFIPYRIYTKETECELNGLEKACQTIISCWYSRHYDGHIRQKYLQNILQNQEAWVSPYILQLVGEYVIEIIESIQINTSSIPKEGFAEFLENNGEFSEVLRQRVISYWNCFYRRLFPKFLNYPGFIVGKSLGLWDKNIKHRRLI